MAVNLVLSFTVAMICVSVGINAIQVTVQFDFRSPVTPSGDTSDFFNINDTVELVCLADPGTMRYAIHIRVNDTITGDMTRLTESALAERSAAQVSTNITAQLDPYVYQCFASHNDPDGVDQSAFFSVFINPFFTFTTSDPFLITNGTQVGTPCIASGNPEPTVQLFFNGFVVIPNLMPSIMTVLEFGNEGMYTCVASTPGADQNAVFNFTIIISPEGSVELSRGPFVEEDTEVTINCTAQGGPGNNFTWFRGNTMISDGGDFSIVQTLPQMSRLTASNLISGSTVQFTCVVTNQAGEDNATETVQVPIQNFLDVSPLNQTVDLGTNATFHCANPGLQPEEYFWIRNHTNPTSVPDLSLIDLSMPGNPYIVTNMPYLTISDVELEDAGIYACVSNNNAVNVTEPVTLYILPNVTNQLMEMFVEAGDRVTFECMATGFPTPTYHWEKEVFLQGFVVIPGEVSPQLVLDPVVHSDFGTYRCVATVSVHEAFTNESNDVVLHVSPARSVDTSPMMQTADHGDNVTFHCHSEGGPNNMYFWVRNASEVCLDCAGVTDIASFLEDIARSNDTIDILMEGMYLLISNVNATLHGGTYFCVAINEAGYGISMSTLYVTPAFVTQPQDIKTTNGSTVEFNCEAQSFPSPSYRWEKLSPTMPIVGAEDRFLEFDPVLFHDFGDYHCVAFTNVSGMLNETESDNATLFVSPEGSIELSPLRLLLDQGDSLTLNCSALGGPDTELDFLLEGSPFTAADMSTFTIVNYRSIRVITVNSVDAALHKGYYTCIASNMAGSENRTSLVIISPLGIVSIVPQNITASRGDNIMFTCETEAGPGNEYYWLFNDSPQQFSTLQDLANAAISMNRTLTLNSITAPDNGGQYTCVAVNEAGNGTSTGTLYVLPEFVVHPQSINTTNGSAFNLTCIAEAFPLHTIQWQRMNRSSGQFEDIVGQTMNYLEFNPVNHGDFGMYHCVATNYINGEHFENISDSALVTVSPEGSIVLTPQNMTFNYTNTAVLTCTVEGGPMNMFSWYLNDTQITSGMNNIIISDSFFYSTLTISSVSAPNHGGTYRCVASNAAGFDQADTLLFVSPRIIEQPSALTLTQNGFNVILVCRAEAFPVPRYLWLDTLNNDQTVGDPEPLLQFIPAVFGNESIYRCRISSNELIVDSQLAQLHVSPLGGLTINPQIINGIHGMNYTTVCSAQGGLNNQFQWTYLRTNTQESTDPTLRLYEVTVLDARYYQCFVSNPAGNETGLFRLNIGPRIVEPPQDQNVSIRVDNITLTCVASAYPLPNITWFQNNTVIQQDDRTTIVSTAFNEIIGYTPDDFGRVTSVLTILNASVNDSGSYRCVADSIPVYSPVSSDDILVLVQDVPQPPHSLDVEDVMSQNLTLVWTAPHDNNAPILGYYIFYTEPSFLGGDDVVLRVNGAVEEFFIEDLHPGEEYTFTILAFNEEGNSSLSDPFTNETMEEAPDGPPEFVRGSVFSATSILLTWELPLEENRLGEIISYDVRVIALNSNGAVLEDFLILEVMDNRILLQPLMEFTNYSLAVRARTAEGFGPFSMPEILYLTNESFPGPLDPPAVGDLTPTSVVLTWGPPEDPNGIILGYQLEYVPLGFVSDPFSNRRRRQTTTRDVLACLEFLNITDITVILNEMGTSVTVNGLVPFTVYSVRVRAMTAIGPGNFSNATTFSTPVDDPGVIVNLRGITDDGSSVRLSWDAPPCPNGPLTGYNIYYRQSTFIQNGAYIDSRGYSMVQIRSSQASIVRTISGLDPEVSYVFHVTAFYDNGTLVREGNATSEILLMVDDQPTVQPSVLDSLTDLIDVDTNSIVIGLPSAENFASAGINGISYYGVVVVPDPDSDFEFDEDDFYTTYPNVQPHGERGSNRYYITFAWNNVSEVPRTFRVGNEDTTFAVRSGENETYFNAELRRLTTHCFYVLIHYNSGVGNEPVVRYVDLYCRETDRGFSLVGLIIGVVLAFIFLCFLLLLCLIIICCCCYKRRRREKQYRVPSPPPPKQKPNFQETETVILNPYVPMGGDKTTVPVMTFPKYVANMHSNQDYLFTEEYSHIEPQHHPAKTASDANKQKDRYLNIPAYDHSRVVLKHCPGSNYINANYIAGFSKDGNFIATQGPMPSTTQDFWCMVWEQDVASIVMLTNLEEKGRTKCHKYWPNSPHESENTKDYGPLRVEFLEEIKEEHQTIRTFYLSKEGSVGRRVKQYHFTSWPDHGVPATYDELLDFVQLVKDEFNPADGPTVVHCSAGVGRTGAFIAVYVEMARAEKDGTVDIYNYVQYMRKQRPSMVLNETEYIFIHDALVKAMRRGMIKNVIIDDEAFEKLHDRPYASAIDHSREEELLGEHQEDSYM